MTRCQRVVSIKKTKLFDTIFLKIFQYQIYFPILFLNLLFNLEIKF